MPIKQVMTSQRVPVKIWTDEVDEKSKEQLGNIASLPFIHHHVAAMPDVHLGIGATIGEFSGYIAGYSGSAVMTRPARPSGWPRSAVAMRPPSRR